MTRTWVGRLGAVALAYGGLVSGAAACSVGATPGVNIVSSVNGGGFNDNANNYNSAQGENTCTNGIFVLDVEEGDSVELMAKPVNTGDTTGCGETNNWANLIQPVGDGGDLTLENVFGDVTGLVTFIASSEPPPPGGQGFSYSITSVGGGIGPGLAAFRDSFTPPLRLSCNYNAGNPSECNDAFENVGLELSVLSPENVNPANPSAANQGEWTLVGAGGPMTGQLSINANAVTIEWFKRVTKDHPVLNGTFYEQYAQADHLGYNPRPGQADPSDENSGSRIGDYKSTGALGSAQIQMNFDTPTFSDSSLVAGDTREDETGREVPGATYGRYAIYANCLLPWNFQNVSIPLEIAQIGQVLISPCNSSDPTNLPDDCNGDGVEDANDYAPGFSGTEIITISLSGNVYKSSEPLQGNGSPQAGNTGADSLGRPSMTLISVRDKTPPLAAEAYKAGSSYPDNDLGTADAGSPLPAGQNAVMVDVWDNNPHATAADYEVEAWALVERSVWTGGAAPWLGHLDNAPQALDHFDFGGNDAMATSSGHAFRWVSLGKFNPNDDGAVVYADETNTDGSPVTVPIGKKFTFGPYTIAEPMGVHFTEDSGQGTMITDPTAFSSWEDGALKVVYRVTEVDREGERSRPVAVPTIFGGDDVSVNNPHMVRQARPWPDGITDDFDSDGPPVAGITLDGFADNTLLAPTTTGGPTDDQPTLKGTPTWRVADTLPPSLVLLAYDLKYERFYYFGDAYRAGATCEDGTGVPGTNECSGGFNQAYLAARADGTTVNPASGFDQPVWNMQIIPPTNPSEVLVFGSNGGDDGYTDVLDRYVGPGGSGSFDPASVPNFPGDPFLPAASARLGRDRSNLQGLWIDEDTRVQFFVSAWDNTDGWELDLSRPRLRVGGPVTVEFELFDEPSTGDPAEVVMALEPSGSVPGLVDSDPNGGEGIYLFRNPNRTGDAGADATLGRSYVRVAAEDRSGNRTEIEVDVFIADNQLRIYSLEESRRRLSN